MKVLFVLSSGLNKRGSQSHLLEAIISRLLSEGWEVHLIEKHGEGQSPELAVSIPESENLIRHICHVGNVEKDSLIRRYLNDVRYLFLSIKHYKKSRDADVIFLQSCNTAFFYTFAMKTLIGRPIIYNVQDIFPLNASMIGMIRRNGLLYRLLSLLERQAYRHSEKIITISADMKKSLVEEGVQEGKIQVIHNWSYTDEILEISDEKNSFLIDKGIDGSLYKIVYAGNLGAVQNVDIVLKAAQRLREVEGIRFYIIGDGVRKNTLMKYAEENGLKNVDFYPMQQPEYAPHIYSMADINVIPLAKGIIKTALPSKTAICLSCGKPIIACVDPDSVFAGMIGSCDKCSIIDSNDAEGLADCILNYYQDNVKERSAGERELFKRTFSKEANTSGYIHAMKEIVFD